MRIGLVNIESKIFNTAYMQIAAYHKQQGCTVDWWSPITDRQFDYVYCSSLFNYTDKAEVPARAICGGTGFDVTSKLSKVIEACDLDYSIYPDCDKSFIWFSRGCIRNCPWCLVRQKEGAIRPVVPKNLNPKGKYIVVQDNNFFANPNWPNAIKQLREWKLPVDFQGVDVRLLTKRMCRALCKLRHYKQIKIAWDDPHDNLVPKLRWVMQFLPRWQLMCYVLIGYWYFTDGSTEEKDLYRIEMLRQLGIDPFVMPYDKTDPYQRAFARWVNRKAIFKTTSWQEYKAKHLLVGISR